MRPYLKISVLVFILIVLCSCGTNNIQITDDEVPQGGDVIDNKNIPSEYPINEVPLYKLENIYFVMSDGYGGTTVSFISFATLKGVSEYYEELAKENSQYSKKEIEDEIMYSFKTEYYFVNIVIKKLDLNNQVLESKSNIIIMVSLVQ